MTTTVPSAALVATGPVFTEPEQLALAGFLASYTGLTRQAYMLDLRQYAAWCRRRHVALFAAWRADIQGFARDLAASFQLSSYFAAEFTASMPHARSSSRWAAPRKPRPCST